jgi:hypothetical protein
MFLSWDVDIFVLKLKPRYSKHLRSIFSSFLVKTKNTLGDVKVFVGGCGCFCFKAQT